MQKLNTTVSAYLLARNEAFHIAAAIDSVSWADEIIVLDTGSTDSTINIAKDKGALVIEAPFNGFGPSRNHALSFCKSEWIFCLDADERCTEALRAEIQQLLQNNPVGEIYLAPRLNYFMGRWIKHSGWYPDYRHPVLFRRQALKYTEDQVHESYTTHLPIYYLKSQLLHYPYQSVEKMLQKANQYSSLGVGRLEKKNKKPCYWSAAVHGLWAFIRQYILQGGFLDGGPGLVLAVNAMQATFFRYVKLIEKKLNENSSSSF